MVKKPNIFCVLCDISLFWVSCPRMFDIFRITIQFQTTVCPRSLNLSSNLKYKLVQNFLPLKYLSSFLLILYLIEDH